MVSLLISDTAPCHDDAPDRVTTQDPDPEEPGPCAAPVSCSTNTRALRVCSSRLTWERVHVRRLCGVGMRNALRRSVMSWYERPARCMCTARSSTSSLHTRGRPGPALIAAPADTVRAARQAGHAAPTDHDGCGGCPPRELQRTRTRTARRWPESEALRVGRYSGEDKATSRTDETRSPPKGLAQDFAKIKLLAPQAPRVN